MYKYLILAALIPAVILQNADKINYDYWDMIAFRPCNGSRPQPTTVWVENCPQMPCELPRGSSFMMVMNYTSQTDATKLRPIVTATLLGITAPFDLPEDMAAACNWLIGERCPVAAGKELLWHLSMPISPIYPLISLITTEIDLRDQDGVTQGCFVYDVSLLPES